jgi:catechol 2,3-dioxygenase-like lactoylglutathione lyase family enzyme
MTVRGLRRVIVSVADLAPALGLYRDVLGFTEKYRAGEIAMLASASGDLELLLHQRPPTPGPAGVAVSYLVDDVDAVTAAAEKVGATVVDAPADQPWGERQAVLTDLDGHVFCLVAPIADPA